MTTVRRARPEELSTLADLAATQQARSDRFMIYCGEDAATISAEVAEVEDWASWLWVAERDEAIVGWLLAEVDDEIGRVWWWGPFLADDVGDWAALADELYETVRAAIGDGYEQEELAFDDRHAEGAALAERHGFVAETASSLLGTDRPSAHTPGSTVRPIGPGDRESVIALHEELFANAHLNGRQLVDKIGPKQYRSVSLTDGRIVGYVATEIQPDKAALIDFVGVAPADQGNGFGRDLVADAVSMLLANGASRCFLTVRENNTPARRLYAGLGFEEERMLRPFRKGFTLD